MSFRLLSLTLLLSLCACSSNPVIPVADRSMTPLEVAQNDTVTDSGDRQWGGVVIATKNLNEATELEVLAYPLDRKGRPDTGAGSSGRFIARQAGYLEAADFRVGRLVTATGRVSEIRTGQVGEADYRFPVLICDDLALWPEESESRGKPRIHFGFGASSGGRSHGSIGVGIGF